MDLTVKMLLLPLLLLSAALHSDAEEIRITSQHDSYVRCPTSNISIGQGSDIITGRSEIQCVARCSQSEDCSGVTVCPGGEPDAAVTCEMRNDTSLGQCLPYPAQCHLINRNARKTSELECEQGGVLEGNKCRCPLPYAGHTCQRYMRDCHEGWENGHNDSSDGSYLIQPIGSSSPFMVGSISGPIGICVVRCEFKWKATYALLRFQADTWASTTWQQLKSGFGDFSAAPIPSYFIGLDRLHELLSQGSYRNHLWFWYDNWATSGDQHYSNFKVGPENTGYQISYNSYSLGSGLADDEFESSTPVVFSATGHDTNGCAAANGAPGWYAAGCTGPGLFQDPPVWSVNGTGRVADWIVFNLYRQSPFILP